MGVHNGHFDIFLARGQAGNQMYLAFVIDSAYLVLGAIMLGLSGYLWRRRKQRRITAMHLDRDAQLQRAANFLNDDFYCIMLKDGSCRSGYLKRPPAE